MIVTKVIGSHSPGYYLYFSEEIYQTVIIVRVQTNSQLPAAAGTFSTFASHFSPKN